MHVYNTVLNYTEYAFCILFSAFLQFFLGTSPRVPVNFFYEIDNRFFGSILIVWWERNYRAKSQTNEITNLSDNQKHFKKSNNLGEINRGRKVKRRAGSSSINHKNFIYFC